jgi:glutathione S-transferase
MGTAYAVQWPEGTVQRASDLETADVATQILLLHYLLAADGTPLASKWIAFRNLPGGLGYDAAFQKRASARLAQAFGSELASFQAGARALGGEPLTFGDASFLFRVLPRVWLAVVLHTADPEFPAEGNVLFDAAASHYLPTEDLAVIGGLLAGRIIKAGGTG